MRLLLFLLFSQYSLATTLPINIITEQWPPYNYRENGQLQGLSVEIVQGILKKLDADNQIEIYPGPRGEKMLDDGPSIFNFSLFRSEAREDKYHWVGPIAEETIFLYKQTGSDIDIKSLEDARNLRVGAPKKGFVRDKLKNFRFQNIEGAHSARSLILMLLNDRVDVIASITEIGTQYVLHKENIDAGLLENTGIVVATLPLYIAVSKDTDESIVHQWQQALDELKKSGEYKKIYDRYRAY